MNTTNPPFDDKNFRKAMAHIFPYTDFLENIRGSIGDKRMTGPLTRAFWGHNEDLTRYEEDIAKAKSLIAASKYADTSAVREIKFNYINTIKLIVYESGFDYLTTYCHNVEWFIK